MRYYNFKLSNDEDWHLKTDQELWEIKEYIVSNKFIRLNSRGSKSIGNTTWFIPEVADVQTCNIAYVTEDEDYQKRIDENESEKLVCNRIIEEIETYKFNFRMKLWMLWSYWGIDNKDFHVFHQKKILEKCKQYKCKLKYEVQNGQ